MKALRIVAAMSLGVFFLLNPGTRAAAHPGNTASDGCHYCRTNCEQYGVAYDERHCHNGGSGGGGGGTGTTSPTTSPPSTSPPETSPPPSTSPPTTSAPSAGPSPAEVTVTPPGPGEAATVIVIEGEPGSRYEVRVASEPQVDQGRLGSDGNAVVEVLVENGAHTATVVLTDTEGNQSEPTVERFRVEVPPPSGARFSVVSEPGAATIVVSVTGGPPQGVAFVAAGDEEGSAPLDEDGTGEVRVTPGDGEYAVAGTVEDFQGQRSDEVTIETVTIGEVSEGTSVGDVVGPLVLLLGLGGGGFWIYRRRQERKIATLADEGALARERAHELGTPGSQDVDRPPSPPPPAAPPPPPPGEGE